MTIANGGFDRSYRLDDHDRNFYPLSHSIDDVRQAAVSKGSNYYSSTAFADFLISCLQAHATNNKAQPFFAYLAFTVPHFPLQASQADIARYRDTYQAGWDVVREVNDALTALRLEVFGSLPRKDIEAALRVFEAIETAATDTPVTSAKG